MKFVKKLSCLLLAASMILPYTAFAENNDMAIAENIIEFSEFPETDSGITLFAADDEISEDEKALVLYIVDEIGKLAPEIDIEGRIAITYGRLDYLITHYLSPLLQYNHPEIFYKCDSIMSSFYQDAEDEYDCTMSALYISYSMTADEVTAKRAMIDSEVNAVIAQTNDSMSDLEKILFVHDYIVSNYEYDIRVYDHNVAVSEQANRTIDKMIEEKTGVCQGYSYLFMYIMNKMGIDCITVPSNACNHMWNKVLVDGEWYNIDVTFDDATPNSSANISHKYFLVNDTEIRKEVSNHHAWNTANWDGSAAAASEADDSKYDEIRKINGSTVYKDGYFWCFDNDYSICKIIFDNVITLRVDSPSSLRDYKWFTPDKRGYYTVDQHSDKARQFMAMALYNGKIYFNSPNKIYRYDTSDTEQGKAVEVYADPRISDERDTFYFGLTVKDGKLYAEDNERKPIIEIPISSEPEPTVTPSPQLILETAPCEATVDAVKDDEGAITVTVEVTIPEKAQEMLGDKKPTVWIAKYDENGVFLGFEDYNEESGTSEFTVTEDCHTVKTFIWANNQPLSYVNPFDILQSFIQ